MSEQPPAPERDDDPELLAELARALGHDPDAQPPPERVAEVRAAARARAHELARPGRRHLLTGGVAAGVAGVAGAAGYRLGDRRDQTRADDEPAAVPVERIVLSGDAEVTTSALVNHTWGTELLLDVRGLRPGAAHDVVFGTTTGEVAAGSLLAVADVVMRCRFSAAPLREAVRTIEVRDPAGTAVLRADLPEV